MMNRYLHVTLNTLVILIAATFLGCQSKGVKETIQRDLDDLQKQIFELQQDQAYINTKVEQTSAQVSHLNKQMEKNEKQLEDIYNAQEKSQKDLIHIKEVIKPKVLSPGSNSKKEPQIVSDFSSLSSKQQKVYSSGGPRKLYNKALDLIRSGKIDNAIPLLQQYIELYPRTELADNAQYWLGECYYKNRDFLKAINGFKKILDDYPSGNKVPAALLKMGYSYYELRQITKALESLQKIINQYPNDPVYSLAQKKIEIILSER